ncbi:MAG: hypothetical protein QOH79_2167 [Acidimicrobiaceae bacterium]
MSRDDATAVDDTVLGLFRECVERDPDQPFLDFEEQRYTYAESREHVARLARGLREAGVRPGDTVGGMLDNNADAIFGWLATNAIGALWVGVNTALKGDFLGHVLNEADVKVLLTEPDYVERLVRVRDDLGQIERVLYRGDGAVDLGGFEGGGLDPWRLDGTDDPLGADVDPLDLTCLIVTGGTTGPSKCCMISNAYMAHFARMTNMMAGRQREDISLNPLPAFHLNLLGCTVVSSLLLGGTAAILPRFSVSGFWPAVERTGATVVHILGSMIALIARMPDTPESERCKGQIRALVGVPFPPDLVATWRERFGIELAGFHGYGLTEACPLTSLRHDETPKPGSSGRRNEHFDVMLLDDDGVEVPVDAPGEIICRPTREGVMFSGYWKRPEATAAATRDGWFYTGDIGRFDEDGFFYFLDRKKDYLRRRGENISSLEVEATFLKHPLIEDVAVHGLPSDLTEDDLKVTAVVTRGQDLDPAALFEWSVDRLPYFALPRYIEFREELPRSPFGRVYKYQLRDDGVTATTWDREAAGVTFERR